MGRYDRLDTSLRDYGEGDSLIIRDKELEPFHRILLLAPHQDDETLGCGGLIQRCCRRKADVRVVFLTDGSVSHPNSSSHAPKERCTVRCLEAKDALATLGVEHEKIFFLNALDSALPNRGEEGYSYYLAKVNALAAQQDSDLIICPCLADPHRDHQATWSIASDVASKRNITIWEYPIWIYELATEQARRLQEQKPHYCLQLSPGEQLRKIRALNCHRSQLDPLVFNDPDGFLLTPQMINHFSNRKEIFYPNHTYEQKNR